jgi:protein-S-isoprenylcysteine O-methyltransferase Ste14
MTAVLITVVIHLPSLPLDIAAGAMFGLVLGTLYSVTVATIGSIFPVWPWLPVISGVLMIAVLLLLPYWVDRHNLFHHRDLFKHVKQDQATENEHCDRK